MAGGYGGQEIALDVNDTPLNIMTPLQQYATLQGTKSETNYRNTLSQELAENTSERQQLFPSQLQVQQNAAALNTAATQRSQLAQAAGKIDASSPDAGAKWDAAMQSLADQGNPDAKQFIGRYNPDLQQRVVGAYSASSPLESMAAMGQDPMALPTLDADTRQKFDLQYSHIAPDQLQSAKTKLDAIRAAMLKVEAAPDKQAAYTQAVKDLGLQGQAPATYNPMQMYHWWQNELGPIDSYLTSRLTESNVGVPNPVVPGQVIKRDDGSLLRVDASGNATTLAGPTEKWTNTADGGALNVRTGAKVDPNGQPIGPSGPAYDRIANIAGGLGANPSEIRELQVQAATESGGRFDAPDSPTGRKGLLQFDQPTFTRYGGKDITNPEDQIRAGLNMLRANHQLAVSAGADDTPQNAYVVAQQGVGGGPALLKASQVSPNAKAVDVLAPFYKDRQTAMDAVTKNGGTADMTAGQFVDHVRGQWTAQDSARPQTAAAQGVRFPTGYDEPTFQNMFWEQAVNGKEPTFTRGPGGSAATAQAAYRQWQANFMRVNDISPADMKNTASMAKAIGSAQSKMVGMQSMVSTSEGTVNNSIGILNDLLDQGAGGPLGAPILNKWIQAGRKATGDPDVVRFDNALHLVANEYTKVMTTTNGVGGGVTSDRAREEAQSLLNGSYNRDQLKGALQLIQQEMDGRKSSIASNLQSLQSGMSQLTPHASQAAAGGPNGVASSANPHGSGYTSAQQAAYQRFEGSTAAGGSEQNPKVPVTQQQYDSLPAGAHYIAQDGSIKVKGAGRQQGT